MGDTFSFQMVGMLITQSSGIGVSGRRHERRLDAEGRGAGAFSSFVTHDDAAATPPRTSPPTRISDKVHTFSVT